MFAPEMIEPNINYLVTKSNKLIEANYKLGVVEQKIILCLASNIQPTDTDFKTYTLPIKEFNELLGLKGTPKYTELRKITKELMQKVFEVRINKKVIQVAWLSYVAYNESEGTIDIRFDPFLRPYLLELKREYTSYKLENVVKLKSSYAIRIYELLKQYEKFHERTILLSDLRKMLGAEDIYPAYGNFKQRVIAPAQKELKEKTDISFEIEEIKVGRRVEKIKFQIISTNKKETEQLSLFQDKLEEFKTASLYENQIKKMILKMGFQISDTVIKSWEQYGYDKVIEILDKIERRIDIENPIGYVTKILKSNPTSNNEVAVTLEEQNILTYLISKFRKVKKPIPPWLIKNKSINYIQENWNLDIDEATKLFDTIEHDLYDLLEIKSPDTANITEYEFEKMKKDLEKRLQKYKK